MKIKYEPTREVVAIARLLRKLDALQREISDMGRYPLVAPYDGRMLAIGRTQLQLACMAINNAIFQPQRIKLPEDGE